MTVKGCTISGGQIDRPGQDWLQKNYGEAIVSEYAAYSLVMPVWNSPKLNDALKKLKQALYFSFGSERPFGPADYYEAIEKLGLPGDRTPVPDVFIRAFATKWCER